MSRQFLRHAERGDVRRVKEAVTSHLPSHAVCLDAITTAQRAQQWPVVEYLIDETTKRIGAHAQHAQVNQRTSHARPNVRSGHRNKTNADIDALLLDAFTQPQPLWVEQPDQPTYRTPAPLNDLSVAYTDSLVRDNVSIGRINIVNWPKRLFDEFSNDANPEYARAVGVLGTLPRSFQLIDQRVVLDKKRGVFVPIVGEFGHKTIETTSIDIAYTRMGDRGPPMVFLHGVPANRHQWWPVQKRCASFARTLALDVLGMGESSKPLNHPEHLLDWVYHTPYVFDVIQKVFGDTPVMLVADDWGAGVAQHFAARYPDTVFALVLQDPIAFDGYPVSEYQAVGRDLYQGVRAAQNNTDAPLAVDKQGQLRPGAFAQAAAAFDQTLVQMFKTMVHNPDSVYNQYSLRTLKGTYVDVNYERLQNVDRVSERKAGIAGEDWTSLTGRVNHHAIAMLAILASRLAPAQLLPYDAQRNPRGVMFQRLTMPVMVLWGAYDNMMPATQVHRFALALQHSAFVHTHLVPDAGHFAATDNPIDVSEQLVSFLSQLVGTEPRVNSVTRPHGLLRTIDADKVRAVPGIADVYFGFSGIRKGDENAVLAHVKDTLFA